MYFINKDGGYSEAQPEEPAEVPPVKSNVTRLRIPAVPIHEPIRRCAITFATYATGGYAEKSPDVSASTLEELHKQAGTQGTKKAAKVLPFAALTAR